MTAYKIFLVSSEELAVDRRAFAFYASKFLIITSFSGFGRHRRPDIGFKSGDLPYAHKWAQRGEIV